VNDLVLLLRWGAVTLGAIYFVTESALVMRPRVWFARRGSWPTLLIYCAACSGFWLGLVSAHWFWPFSVSEASWSRYIEGAVAAMALGAIWSKVTGGNPAYEVEAELICDHTLQKEEEPTNAEG